MTRLPLVGLCLVLVGALSTLLGGCGKSVEYSMRPAARTPAASGTIKVSETEHNRRLEIEVAFLPPPERLHPSLSTFVVWGSLPGEGPESARNLGQIPIDDDRRGSLDVVTPYQNLDIRVSAESSPTPERPSEFVVLEGNVTSSQLR